MAQSSQERGLGNMPGDIRTPAASTAMLVMNSSSGPLPCPFFAKCDGVLLIHEPNKSTEFHRHTRANAKSLCDLILALNPCTLICGFIGEAEKQRLRRAGIDVRLGSCSYSIDELLAGRHNLPQA
jgi:hypothetical protein